MVKGFTDFRTAVQTVSPGPGVDVSGWTLANRMQLPDWCFPNREAIGCEANCVNANQDYWAISEIALPDPVCFWSLAFWFREPAFARIRFRFGLRSTVPTSAAEMNTATEILPYVGAVTAGPNFLRVGQFDSVFYQLMLRKGMETGLKKLVLEVQSDHVNTRADLVMIFSGLPKRVPAFLDPEVT